MKFTEHLQSHLTPEWRKQYIQYEWLKDYLYKYIEEKPNNSDEAEKYFDSCDDEFFELCRQELVKIDNFFSEKLAEAKRKFDSLNDDVMLFQAHVTDKGKKPVVNDERPNHLSILQLDNSQLNKRKTSRWVPNRQRKYRTHHDLKLAYSEFYLSLILLQNFQTLNFTGFRKILKKHDKLFARNTGSQWRINNVDKAPFHINTDVDGLIVKVETIYTNKLEAGDRQKAMKRLRVPPLSELANPWVTFRLGLYLGIFLVMIVLIFTLLIVWYEKFPQICIPAVRLFRSTYLLLFFMFLIGMDMHCWRKSGVNHVLIFEIDPRNHRGGFEVMEKASGLMVIWSLAVIYFIMSPSIGTPSYLGPFLIVLFLIAYLCNPLPIFHYESRIWLLNVLKKILVAPMYSVKFADFWLADQLNSLSFLFVDIGFFVCFYGFKINYEHGFKTNADISPNYFANIGINKQNFYRSNYTIIDNGTCSSLWYGIIPVLRALPAWFRFAQCLRRFSDNHRQRKLFPHIWNAGKYLSTILVVITSSIYSIHYTEGWCTAVVLTSYIITTLYTTGWDISCDWGLMTVESFKMKENRYLREELVYPYKIYYYLAIIEDVLIRLRWVPVIVVIRYNNAFLTEIVYTVTMTAEVIRRCIWNLFRLENEHLNNCGEFRAVRDIFVAPIKSSFDEPKQNNLTIPKTNGRLSTDAFSDDFTTDPITTDKESLALV